MSVEIKSGASSDKLTIGATSKAARVELYDANGNPISYADASDVGSSTRGGLVMGVDHDTVRAIEVSRFGRIEVPNRRVLLADPAEGTTINTQRWTSTATTMTATQAAASGITLNGSAITTINTGIALSSRYQHLRMASQPMHSRARTRSTLVANQEGMIGLFFQATLSATAGPTANDSGAFWKWGTDASIKPSLVYNGAEVSLGTDVAGSLNSANYYDFHVLLDDDRAVFQVFNSATGLLVNRQTLKLAVTGPRMLAATHVYTYMRVRNAGSAPATPGQLIVDEIETCTLETGHNHPWMAQLAENTLGAAINPTAYTQAQQFGNSAAPGSAALSNTVAAYTTLGGLWQFAAVAGAATDYVLFSYQIPTPYTLKITGVHVAAWNTGAANAATPATMMMWGLGLNGSVASLASGAHIRRLIGQTTIPASAAIGASAQDVEAYFEQPLICYPGTHLAIILRIVAGAATASQVPQGFVDVRGVFE